MDAAVYLFTGFMDSGKTTLIKETVVDADFAEGKSLVIACEDGDIEYNEEQFKEVNCSVVMLESEDDLTTENLVRLDEVYQPEAVFLEYNGTWQAAKILELELPKGWEIIQQLATIDASTFELYLTNMRTMMMEQVFNADVVIFNRCTDDTPKGKFRRTIKARNPKAQIVYEREDGTIDDNFTEELPYDLNQDLVEITDMDFGIFYLDIQDDPRKYDKKKIRFLALVYRPEEKFGRKPIFVGGRFAMTCCVEDIQYIGFKCKYEDAPKLKNKDWIWLTAQIRYEFAKEYRGRGPVLYVEQAEPAEAPEQDVVYFN